MEIDIPAHFYLFETVPVGVLGLTDCYEEGKETLIPKITPKYLEPNYRVAGERIEKLKLSFDSIYELRRGYCEYFGLQENEYKWILTVTRYVSRTVEYPAHLEWQSFVINHCDPHQVNGFFNWLFAQIVPQGKINMFLRDFDEIKLSLPVHMIERITVATVESYHVRYDQDGNLKIRETYSSIYEPDFWAALKLNPEFDWITFKSHLKADYSSGVRSSATDVQIKRMKWGEVPLIRCTLFGTSYLSNYTKQNKLMNMYTAFKLVDTGKFLHRDPEFVLKSTNTLTNAEAKDTTNQWDSFGLTREKLITEYSYFPPITMAGCPIDPRPNQADRSCSSSYQPPSHFIHFKPPSVSRDEDAEMEKAINDSRLSFIARFGHSPTADIVAEAEKYLDMMNPVKESTKGSDIPTSTPAPPPSPVESVLQDDATSAEPESDDEELPECTVCYERVKTRSARKLPCDHGFCVKCVILMFNNAPSSSDGQREITCPFCSQKSLHKTAKNIGKIRILWSR